MNPSAVSVWLPVMLLAALVGCGDSAETPCVIEGSGFQASHECRYRCLQFRPITCPDGSRVNPSVCSGPEMCDSADCPAGQVCYHFPDPFQQESFCVAASVCGSLSEPQLRAWETQSRRIARQLREAQSSRSDKAAPTALPATAPME